MLLPIRVSPIADGQAKVRTAEAVGQRGRETFDIFLIRMGSGDLDAEVMMIMMLESCSIGQVPIHPAMRPVRPVQEEVGQKVTGTCSLGTDTGVKGLTVTDGLSFERKGGEVARPIVHAGRSGQDAFPEHIRQLPKAHRR